MTEDLDVDAVYDAYPDVRQWAETLGSIDVASADTVLAPEDVFTEDDVGEGYWVGAPAVYTHERETYLMVRERAPDERGRAVTLYREDMMDPVTHITADDLDVVSIERAGFAETADGLRCYLPVDHGAGDWSIAALDPVDHPADLDPDTAKTVLTPTDGASDSATVKDPAILDDGETYHMFYAGDDGRSEQAHHAVSKDGTQFETAGVVLPREGWHDHHTRIAEAVPAGNGQFLVYEGSGRQDYGRTWNLRTGFAYLENGETVDLTQDAPDLSSPTADAETALDTFGTCRYLALTDDTVYMEVAREDGAFDLRKTPYTRPEP